MELFSTGRMTVNNENLRITNVSLDDTGLYTCVVTNGEEKAEDDKSIQVIPKGKSKELYYAQQLGFLSIKFYLCPYVRLSVRLVTAQ